MTKTKRSAPWNLASFVTTKPPKTTLVFGSTLLQQHDPKQPATKAPLSLWQMAKTSWNLKEISPERWTEPTNNEQIQDAHPKDKRRTYCVSDKANANNASWTPQEHEHNTATDDSILPRLSPRYLTRNIAESFTLSILERCQVWVPSESFEKFLLELTLNNDFEKQNKEQNTDLLSSLHVHRFWRSTYWRHVWTLQAHKVSYTLIDSGVMDS